MGNIGELLTDAREAFARRDWLTALDRFKAARAQGELSGDDAYLAADSAWWLGRLDEFFPVAEVSYRLFLEESQPRKAAATAFTIAYSLSLRGDESIASGWASRGLRLLQDQPECVEHGFMAYTGFEMALAGCDYDAAIAQARRIGEMGKRFGDPTLQALSVLGEGRALVRQGRVADGMRLLDEAMLAALSDDIEPGWAGNIYCHLMLACYELSDFKRAGEWTRATAKWCESMPGAGPFMGICRVHRCQVLQIGGEWDEAEREALRVCEELAHFHVSIVAQAHYHVGDLRRARGDLARAEDAFRRAHQLGRDPQPGLALLRLAQGQVEVARSSIRAALAGETRDRLARSRLCAVEVEIALAAGEIDAARTAAAELEETAAAYGSSGLKAMAAHAGGAVALADGDVGGALQTLRDAFRYWQELGAPYETARVRLLLAEALEKLGDRDAASFERDAARAAFDRLGIVLPPGQPAPSPMPALLGDLTAREFEVLQLAARGMSNNDIAKELVLSVRTVERHLSTIYQKLGFEGRNARTAAVSFALRGDSGR